MRQTFTNKEQEGRVEVQLTPFNARFAAVTTAFGVQASHQELTAPSPDDPGSPLNGLWDPNNNTQVAGYIFNEFKFSETTKAQIAGRIEHVNLSGTTPAFIPELFDLNANPGDIGPPIARNLTFTPKSAQRRADPEPAVAISSPASPRNMSSARRSRPNCFRAAAHDATVTFDIGNPNLDDRNRQVDRTRIAPREGACSVSKPTAYYTKFNGFIYRRLTGNTCEDVACVGPGDRPGRWN